MSRTKQLNLIEEAEMHGSTTMSVITTMYDIIEECGIEDALAIDVRTCISHQDMSRRIILASSPTKVWDIISIYTDKKGNIVFDIEEDHTS